MLLISILIAFVFLLNTDFIQNFVPQMNSSEIVKKNNPPQALSTMNNISLLYIDPSKNLQDQPHDFYIHYFNTVLAKNTDVKKMYDLILHESEPTESKKLIAIYFAEFAARNQSAEFSVFMKQLHQNIIENSEQIHSELELKHHFYAQNSFMNQIAMNLVMQLNISPRYKVEFMGKTLSKKIDIDNSGKIISDLSNLTVSLALLKAKNIQLEDIKNTIEESLKQHKKNPIALQEFNVRLTTYYPDYYKESIQDER